jgi:O-antigen/teichoic acid export membrane protein
MATTFRLDPEMIQGFKKNMKAIILQNIGMYLIFGIDSILISYFVSFIAVGLYSNYKMFFEICRTFVNQIFANIFHSVGNLVAQESKEKIYGVYKATMLLTFWLYGLLSILLYLMLEPLIRLWIGNEFIMDNLVLLLLVIMFWERGMRYSLTTVKITSGIFQEDRYGPLAQAAINLAVSLFLVHKMGIAGVFLGSLISAVCIPFWTIPYLVYKKVFQISIANYYKMYFYYLAIGLVSYFLARFAVQGIPDDHILMFLVKGMIVFVVVNACFFVMFRKSDEFKFLMSIAVTLGQKIPIVNRFVKKRLAVSGA